MNEQVRFGVDHAAITGAEQELKVIFPEVLKEIWKVSNGLELPSGWILYPIFDPSNPRKTCDSIVYENTRDKGRWDYMPDDLITIAGNGTGNQLVLKMESGILSSDVFVWNHERNTIKRWGKTLDYILARAIARVEAIKKAQAKSVHRK